VSYFTPFIDSSGLHLPTYQDILEDMIDLMKSIYGQDIYLGNDAVDYQFLSILALKIADSYQAVQYAYNARSPQTAIGATLDSIVKLNGLERKAAGYSTCEVTLTGTPFTEIKKGSVKDTSGLIWDLPASVVIGSNGTLTTTVTCETAGAKTAGVGNISQINTPTYGWVSVTNNSTAVPGVAEETDAELRERQAISVANPSQSMLAGTRGALIALDNVTRVACYENDTNISKVDADNNPYGLPPHSVTCVVEGGSDTEIAESILYHKGLGCYTNGTTEVEVVDVNDYPNKVRFSRPTYVPVFVSVKVAKYTGYVDGTKAKIQAAVYGYIKSLEIGQTLSYSLLMGVITDCNTNVYKPTFGVSELLIGRTADSKSAVDMAITYNEVAQPVYDNITVEV